MVTYTAADAERVFNQDTTEIHKHYARSAAEQRPAVRRAIAQLTGAPPTENNAEPESAEDSDEADAELAHDGQRPDVES